MLITETRFVNGSGNVNNEKTVPRHNVKTFGKSLILFHWFDAIHMSAKKFRPEDWRQVTYPSTRVGSCSFRLKRVIFSVQSKALDLKTDRPNWLWKPKETSLLTWSDISEFQNSYFQNWVKCKTILVKMSFICMRIKNNFHINGLVLSLWSRLRLSTRPSPNPKLTQNVRLWAGWGQGYGLLVG